MKKQKDIEVNYKNKKRYKTAKYPNTPAVDNCVAYFNFIVVYAAWQKIQDRKGQYGRFKGALYVTQQPYVFH